MKKNVKDNAILWTVIIVIVIIAIVIAQNEMNKVNASVVVEFKDGGTLELLDNENKIDPHITLLSKYIKIRKPSTPIEFCDIIASEIINQSKFNGIADDIIVGIIEIESMWDPTAKSKAGARGLMQILLEDGVEIDPRKAYGIAYNIEKGIAIFKSKLRKADGNITLALKYYVGGDKDYHKAVYKYVGKYTLYKIEHSKKEFLDNIKIVKG